MRKIYNGIHKRLHFLIDHHTLGYDIDYKIKRISQQYKFPEYKARQLYTKAAEKNILHYEELIKNGIYIDTILDMMEKDNKIIKDHFSNVFSFVNNYR